MLESYLPHPAAITDEQVSLFLKLLFHQDSTRQLMERIFAGNGSLEAKDTDWERPWLASSASARGLPLWKMAQLYTSRAGALRPAGGVLRKAMDFPLIFNPLQIPTGEATHPLRWLVPAT